MATFTPPPEGAYVESDGTWVPLTSNDPAVSPTPVFTPPPTGLYAFNETLGQWVPWTGGGSGGAVTPADVLATLATNAIAAPALDGSGLIAGIPSWSRATVTASGPITAAYTEVDSSGGPVTLTLPTSGVLTTIPLTIKWVANGNNLNNPVAIPSVPFPGPAFWSIGQAITFMFDGTSWQLVGGHGFDINDYSGSNNWILIRPTINSSTGSTLGEGVGNFLLYVFVREVTADTTQNPGDGLIVCNTSGGNIAVTLGAPGTNLNADGAPFNNALLYIKNLGPGTVTVAVAGGTPIDGQPSITVPSNSTTQFLIQDETSPSVPPFTNRFWTVTNPPGGGGGGITLLQPTPNILPVNQGGGSWANSYRNTATTIAVSSSVVNPGLYELTNTGTITITLPDATTAPANLGGLYIFKQTNPGGSNVQFTTVGGQTIDGTAGGSSVGNQFFNQPNDFGIYISDGANWKTIGRNGVNPPTQPYGQGGSILISSLNGHYLTIAASNQGGYIFQNTGITYTAADSPVSMNGTAPTLLLFDTTGGPITVNLLDASNGEPNQWTPYFFKNRRGTDDVTLVPFGAQTIDGSTTSLVITPGGCVSMEPDGISDWIVLTRI